MTLANFQIYLKIFMAVMAKTVDLALRAVIDSLEIHTINSLIRKKLMTNLIMSKAFYGVA